ncbi:hypothetical protein FPRO04_03751 [Fusarium proliferatum]|nr:hypothetical protein FPRO03_05943 [Fusarium proliferatum]KAG4268662.1 hypothetical protein FPRO04_03751 [Fusarium proliferatum]
MKPDFAVVLFTLITSTVASAVDAPRRIKRIDIERPDSGGGGSRGVGPQPSFAGGRYYPGGSSKPYKSGVSSPGRIAPFALGGAALAFWPGLWLYGAYMYPYSHPYHYHNDTSDEDEERDVLCGCSRYEYCACDDNNSTQYFDELIGNGSYDALNKSIVNVAEVNGTMTILINGTLPNDTALPDENASDNGALSRRDAVERVANTVTAGMIVFWVLHGL